MRIAVSAVIAALLVGTAVFAQTSTSLVNPGTPEPDCTMHVNYDRNADLPGYRLGTACIPFTRTYQLIPAGQGRDFYVTGFSDAAIRKRWEACRQDAACHEAALTGAKPFIAYEPRLTGAIDASGRIDPEGDVDLKAIRRPAYFGAPAYAEPLAEAESRTYTVEFTVPRDSYERRHLGKTGAIKLRGWYLEGAGIAEGAGPKQRALVILNNGGGSELTAIDNPKSPGVQPNASGHYVLDKQPDALSEQYGMRYWRGFVGILNQAGFDVLITDRRGNGISGGVAGFNTAEQANDMYRELDQMQSGEGLRVLAPNGEVLAGPAVAGKLMAGLAGPCPRSWCSSCG